MIDMRTLEDSLEMGGYKRETKWKETRTNREKITHSLNAHHSVMRLTRVIGFLTLLRGQCGDEAPSCAHIYSL